MAHNIKLPNDMRALAALHSLIKYKMLKSQQWADDDLQLLWDIEDKMRVLSGGQVAPVSEDKKAEEALAKRFEGWGNGQSFNDFLSEQEKMERNSVVEGDTGDE